MPLSFTDALIEQEINHSPWQYKNKVRQYFDFLENESPLTDALFSQMDALRNELDSSIGLTPALCAAIVHAAGKKRWEFIIDLFEDVMHRYAVKWNEPSTLNNYYPLFLNVTVNVFLAWYPYEFDNKRIANFVLKRIKDIFTQDITYAITLDKLHVFFRTTKIRDLIGKLKDSLFLQNTTVSDINAIQNQLIIEIDNLPPSFINCYVCPQASLLDFRNAWWKKTNVSKDDIEKYSNVLSALKN